jgi:hypothetical protein
MSSAAAGFSPRFTRAASIEREQVAGRLEKAKAKARDRKGELALAEADVAELEARLAALEPLLDERGAEPSGPPGAVRGRSIREVAVALLVGRGADAGPIHYRAWLALLEEAGHAVAGKRPDAVFLNQVTRHPLIRATTRRGFYEFDPGGAERLEARVAELRASLATATAAEADGPLAVRNGRDSHQVSLELGRAERALAEARDSLGEGARR